MEAAAASRRSYLTSSLGKRALMIFSIGSVVYMYSLASFLDRDSVHCGGRPILAPPPLGELAATESGVATSAMARLCSAMCRSGPGVRALGKSGEARGVFEAGTMGHLGRLESGMQRETGLVLGGGVEGWGWGWGWRLTRHFGSYGETRGNAFPQRQRGAGCLLYNVRTRLCQPACGPGARGWHLRCMLAGLEREGGCAAGRGCEGAGAELLIRD